MDMGQASPSPFVPLSFALFIYKQGMQMWNYMGQGTPPLYLHPHIYANGGHIERHPLTHTHFHPTPPFKHKGGVEKVCPLFWPLSALIHM